jgi:hypothetical protein
MAAAEFPSGLWTGYYQYRDGRRGHQDLNLQFAAGRMTGSGTDEVGGFVVEGSYDTSTSEAQWQKRYPNGHLVEYRGFREGPVDGIWGTWHIPKVWSGGFHIWPLGEKTSVDLEDETEQPLKAPAPHHVVHTRQ